MQPADQIGSSAHFWDEINARRDRIERSVIVVRADDSLVGSIGAYKVYFNGFIRRTGARLADTAPANSVYARVEAGTYRVVVREHVATKQNRLESNSVVFAVCDDEQVTLCASGHEGRIVLSVA